MKAICSGWKPEDDAGEVLEVALDGCEGVIDVTGDFGRLFA